MDKMTQKGFVVGLLTAVLVWTTVRIGIGGIHDVADFFSGSGNASYLWGTNLLLMGWALRLRLYSIIGLTLKIDVAVLLIVEGFKLVSENFMLGQWTWRPSGSPTGFPSGHATHAFAMAFLLSYFFPRLWLLWYSVAAAIAWSRIEMSAHTSFQVTAGICFGLAIGYGLIRTWRTHPDFSRYGVQSQSKIAA